MSLALLKEAHEWFHDEHDYIYRPDGNIGYIDRWQILKPVNGQFKGDCEDTALTKMDYMLGKGAYPDDLYIVRCATEMCPRDKPFDHAILLFIDNNGKWYFCDQRYSQYGVISIRDLKGYNLYDAVSLDNLRGVGKPERIGMI